MLSGRMAMPAEIERMLPEGGRGPQAQFERFESERIILFIERELLEEDRIEFEIPQRGRFVLDRNRKSTA